MIQIRFAKLALVKEIVDISHCNVEVGRAFALLIFLAIPTLIFLGILPS